MHAPFARTVRWPSRHQTCVPTVRLKTNSLLVLDYSYTAQGINN